MQGQNARGGNRKRGRETMIKLEDTVIEKMELLAKLTIEESEKQRTIEEMEKLLAYAEKINEPDTEGISPLPYMNEGENVFREDVITNPDGKEETLQNAPKREDGWFVVPKTV